MCFKSTYSVNERLRLSWPRLSCGNLKSRDQSSWVYLSSFLFFNFLDDSVDSFQFSGQRQCFMLVFKKASKKKKKPQKWKQNKTRWNKQAWWDDPSLNRVPQVASILYSAGRNWKLHSYLCICSGDWKAQADIVLFGNKPFYTKTSPFHLWHLMTFNFSYS